jgi:hypothetical protein
MIFAGLSPAANGPYGASIKATNVVERKVRHGPAATRLLTSPGVQGGQRFFHRCKFNTARTAAREKELRVYSQSKPEFFRIYRFEQGVDVVRGASTDRNGCKVTFAAGELSPLFDGTEQLISVTSVPFISAKSICLARKDRSQTFTELALTTSAGAPPCTLAAPAALPTHIHSPSMIPKSCRLFG